ncbi:uncharacterized protein CG1339 [Drosophila ficusphila]|uniref:uncharacterized protein CG1339 n=1 Tax=Drosophila ficusphila TaxID=30025 RepID=UPI0007E7781C|nr:uncharacterized protein CG1339 [Drosophila ficusphila]
MSNNDDFRRHRKKPSQIVNRFIFKGSAWVIYAIAHGLHFFKLRYNERSNQLEEVQHHRIWSKIVVAIKVLLIAGQYVHYFVLVVAIYIYTRLMNGSTAQNLVMSVLMQGIGINVLRRLVIFLHAKSDRRLVKHIVNEILKITSVIERKIGMVYSCDPVLLTVYLCKLWLLYILLDSLWNHSYFLLLNFLYWVLLEYCFAGYFMYQLILLSWYSSIIRFLQRFIDDNENRMDIESQYHRRLFLLLELHLRINNLHKCIKDELSWLLTSIYLMIFTSIFNMELLIECTLFAEDELENKLYIIADGCLGPVFIPILYVLILGMCTDRFRDAELQLQQLIVIIQGLYTRKAKPRTLAVIVLDNEHTSLILHQKLEPLQNRIILGTTCDRQFVMEYILTVILTALSLVQYTISCGQSISECVTHK